MPFRRSYGRFYSRHRPLPIAAEVYAQDACNLWTVQADAMAKTIEYDWLGNVSRPHAVVKSTRQPGDRSLSHLAGSEASPRSATVRESGYVLLLLRPVLTRSLVPQSRGPLDEYDERVYSRVLRDDEHQRGMATNQLRRGSWV